MSVDSNTPVDPRVQIELEKLNTATDNINKYEVELDEAKGTFKQLLIESVDKIKQSAHKLSNSIQSAKPYYEARLYAAQLSKEYYKAVCDHEKAKSIHAAAKEMVYLAEQGLGEKSTLDTACQEMLSHAASRVNQSQIECIETRNMMKICELKQEVANNRVSKLQSQLKSAIKASRPYYETRANYNGILKTQKKHIMDLEAKVSSAKTTYNEALKNLELISEEIHKMREDRRRSSSNDFISNEAVIDMENDHYATRRTSHHHSNDEYLHFPSKLSTQQSSTIHQNGITKNDLLRDFVSYPYEGSSNSEETIVSPNQTDITQISSDDIEQWTEIRLSASESSSSGYSHQSNINDHTPTESVSSSSGEEHPQKVTCTTIFKFDDDDTTGKKSGSTNNDENLSNWITKSNLKNSSRRQSLDILIDAGDRVKDVFTSGFFKVGKSLERRNSESEVNSMESSDFFSFSRSENKDGLSDEQVENLLLNEECMTDMLKNVLTISK